MIAAGACVAIAAALVPASYASAASSSGSQSDRARLQRSVADTHLGQRLAANLGDRFAGVWLAPDQATFHVGVTSSTDATAAQQVAAQAGFTGDVVTTPVRSTWAQLIAAQKAWNSRLAKLLVDQQASTGLRPSRNEVAIVLSSSLPAAEREQIERAAAAGDVNTSVTIVAPSQLAVQPRAKCKSPFVSGKAYCETTLVSGVSILPGTAEPDCTAGAMLVSGNETYMLTSGHCYGLEEVNGEALIVSTKSAYINLVQKEIGDEVTKWLTKSRDMAEVRIPRGTSAFIGALPTPMPALMAEWKASPEKPRLVSGQAEATEGLEVCHEGMVSGEACGKVVAVNVMGSREHQVEVDACGSKGDSGGPYFMRGEASTVFIVGMETAGPAPECKEEGPYISFFEPLLGLPGAAEFSILSTFKGQKLLTTATETRGKGPFYRIKGTLGGKSSIEGKSGKEFVVKTETAKLKCTKVNLEKASVNDSSGEETLVFEACSVEGNGEKCEVEGKTFKSEPLQTTLAFTNKESKKGETLLASTKPVKGNVIAKLKFTGASCKLKETAIEGSMAAEALSAGKAVKLEEEPAEAETSEVTFPEKAIATSWVESEPEKRTEVKQSLTAFGKAATLTGNNAKKLVGGGNWSIATK
jgi:hypothetical protein